MGFAKYTMRGHDILKDGHVMFLKDICKDLNRKSYLEEQNLQQTTNTQSTPCPDDCAHRIGRHCVNGGGHCIRRAEDLYSQKGKKQ